MEAKSGYLFISIWLYLERLHTRHGYVWFRLADAQTL